MAKQCGPLMTDEEFFGRRIDYRTKGLEKLEDAVRAGDYKRCREIFGAYVRTSLKNDEFFSCLPPEKEVPAQELLEKAELAMRHVMTSCEFAHDFNGPVDWFANPTYNGYKEWTWQLSRHAEWLTLARAYRLTKDEKYAKECWELFDSWVKQATRYSVEGNNSEALCWRSIECGIRMSLVWPEVLHSILPSEFCTDDRLTDWYKSICEHALLLRHYHMWRGNWLIMEMSGLANVTTLYPCFCKQDDWYAYAIKKLKSELQTQVYPDGFQFELSTSYQVILVIHYGRVIRLLRAYGKEVPEEFETMLRKVMHIYVKLMRPNKALPDLNDGSLKKVSEMMGAYVDLFPDDAVLAWAGSDGEQGEQPTEKSVVLPYSGTAVFRTGWNEGDTWLCFDGGPFGNGHQHEDKLSVLMHCGGKYVLTEGNNYAYDDSEMRQYAISARAHNTVLVDGMGQNRRKNYRWRHELLQEKSDIQTNLSDAVDSARAIYCEGYGEETDKTVTHERSVYFVKKAEGLPLFAVIVDRLTAETGEHTYEVQYHLDSEQAVVDGLNVTAEPLRLLSPASGAELSVEKGVTEPEWNGWTADTPIQGDYRAIYIVKYILRGQNVRWVTVLLPMNGEEDCIAGVEADTAIADTKIVIKRKDGKEFCFDENDWLERE